MTDSNETTGWQSKVRNLNQIIEVPKNGWYGVCLNITPSMGIRPTWAGDEESGALLCSKIYKLRVEKSGSPALLLDVPFRENDKSILSLHFGKVIYLERKCRVCVVTTESDKEKQTVKLHLMIFVHRWPPKDFACPSDLTSDVVLCNDLKKRLVCARCTKGFTGLKGINQHLASAHPECVPSIPLLWRTPLPVVFSDRFLVVIDKPQGMTVQGGIDRTLLRSDLLLALANPPNTRITWPDARQDKVLKKPVPVHRLDAPTGGLLLLAKSKVSERILKNAFADRSVRKCYRALLYGNVKEDVGIVDHPISEKASISRYTVVTRVRSVDFGWLTLVDFHPETGRRHQLRKHAHFMGHGICGDERYYPRDLTPKQRLTRPFSRLCLWATELSIPHPLTAETVSFQLPPLEWLQSTIELEEEAWQKLHVTNTKN